MELLILLTGTLAVGIQPGQKPIQAVAGEILRTGAIYGCHHLESQIQGNVSPLSPFPLNDKRCPIIRRLPPGLLPHLDLRLA